MCGAGLVRCSRVSCGTLLDSSSRTLEHDLQSDQLTPAHPAQSEFLSCCLARCHIATELRRPPMSQADRRSLDTNKLAAILPPLDGRGFGFLRTLMLGIGRGPDSESLASLTNHHLDSHEPACLVPLAFVTSQQGQASIREGTKGRTRDSNVINASMRAGRSYQIQFGPRLKSFKTATQTTNTRTKKRLNTPFPKAQTPWYLLQISTRSLSIIISIPSPSRPQQQAPQSGPHTTSSYARPDHPTQRPSAPHP